MWLLIIGFLGLILGDGLFLYWLVHDFHGVRAAVQDRLALSFMTDSLLTLGILTVYFARTPPGRVRWPWFVALSVIGGVCFGLPVYWWLNKRGGTAAVATAA